MSRPEEGGSATRNRNLTYQPHHSSRGRYRRTAENTRSYGSFAMQYPVHRNNYNYKYYSVTPTRFFRVDHRNRNVQNRIQNVKRKPRKLPEKRYSRPPSPSVGNKEEDKLRRIRETSDMIKELMMSPKLNAGKPTSQDTGVEKEGRSAEDVSVKPLTENNEMEKLENKRSVKSTSGNRNESNYSVSEIHDKIIKHISNLSYKKKMKLISSASAGYNIVFDQIAKQKQLELSKALRDMCSEPSPENTEQISSIMPDFDIKIEELPIEMIHVLSNTLGFDFENTGSLQSFPSSSLETDKEVNSGSQGDELDDCIIIKNEWNEHEDTFESNGMHLNQNVNAISDFEKSQDDAGIVQMKSQTANTASLLDNSLVEDQSPYCSQIDSALIKREVNEPEDCFDINYYSCPGGSNISVISDFEKSQDDAGIVQMKSQTANTASLLDNSLVEDQISYCSQIDSVGIKTEVNESEDCFFTNYDSCPGENFDEVAQESTIHKEPDVNRNTENLTIDQSQNSSYPLQLNGIENNKTTCTSTQTDCSIYQSQLTNSIDPAKPRTLEESVSLMYDIDKEILRLTELRQSLFVNLSRKDKEVPVQPNPSNLQAGEHIKRKPKRKEKKKAKRLKLTCNEKDVADPTTPETPAFNFNYDKELFFEIDHEKILDVKIFDKELACVSESGQLFFVDMKNGKTLRKVKVTDNGRPATSICFWKPKNHIFVGGFDSTMKEYDLKTRLVVKSIPMNYGGLQVEITCLELCWNFIFIGTSDGVLLRYFLSKSKITFADRISESSLLVLKGTQEGARRILIIGSKNSPVCIRDAMSGLHMRVMDDLLAPTVYSLLLKKHLVYCGTTSHDILVFNFHDGTLVTKYKIAGNKSIGCMKVVNKLLFASCHNGSIYIYNTELHKCVGCIKGPGGIILSMEVVGNMIIVGTMSRNFKSIIIPALILNSNK